MPKMSEQGWSLDQGFDQMVPPGWIRDPHYAAPPGGEDEAMDAPGQ